MALTKDAHRTLLDALLFVQRQFPGWPIKILMYCFRMRQLLLSTLQHQPKVNLVMVWSDARK